MHLPSTSPPSINSRRIKMLPSRLKARTSKSPVVITSLRAKYSQRSSNKPLIKASVSSKLTHTMPRLTSDWARPPLLCLTALMPIGLSKPWSTHRRSPTTQATCKIKTSRTISRLWRLSMARSLVLRRLILPMCLRKLLRQLRLMRIKALTAVSHPRRGHMHL